MNSLLKLANELSVARDVGSNYFCVIKSIQKLAQMNGMTFQVI